MARKQGGSLTTGGPNVLTVEISALGKNAWVSFGGLLRKPETTENRILWQLHHR